MIASWLGTTIWLAVGLVMMVFIWRTGTALLRSMTNPLPPPPPPGEMRKINVRYQCAVCGLEIKLLLAPDEDPPPPRHCLEDMLLVAPIE